MCPGVTHISRVFHSRNVDIEYRELSSGTYKNLYKLSSSEYYFQKHFFTDLFYSSQFTRPSFFLNLSIFTKILYENVAIRRSMRTCSNAVCVHHHRASHKYCFTYFFLARRSEIFCAIFFQMQTFQGKMNRVLFEKIM